MLLSCCDVLGECKFISKAHLNEGSFWIVTVNCAERGDEGKKIKPELPFIDTVKIKYWEKLLSEVPAHWDSTHQNQELSGTLETCSQIHRQAYSITDERLLTAVQLNPLIYLAYSLSEISLQLFIANDPRQHSHRWDKHSKFELSKHF